VDFTTINGTVVVKANMVVPGYRTRKMKPPGSKRSDEIYRTFSQKETMALLDPSHAMT